jgi:outer membrane protein
MNKLLLALLLVFTPVTIASADIKVAVIDLSKAFDEFWKTKEDRARLKEKEDGYTKELQDLVTDYNHMGEEAQGLEKAKNDPTLSPAAQADKGKALDVKKQDLMAMGNKIQQMKVERQHELQEEMLRRHKEIVDEITKVITDYAGPAGYDMVLDKSSTTASGVSVVLYNSSKLFDITTDVISKLNATAPATPAGAAPTASAAH